MRFYLNVSTGKEKDTETGYGYFGARYMDHELMTMWLSVDPMADKYPSISPYAYCAWNPIKLVDPNGEDIDPSCQDEWNAQKMAIQDRKKELERNRNNLISKTSSWGQRSRERQVNKLNERIKSLDETLSTMGNLEGDHSTTYTLSRTEASSQVSLITEGEKKGMVSIAFSSTTSFVHEVTHAGQYYSNDIGFFLNTGGIAAYDIFDEVQAYKAALAYSPYAYDNIKMSMSQVTPEWVLQRSKTYAGCGTIPINIFSSAELIKSSGISNLGQYQTYLDIPSDILMYRH